MRKVIIIYIIFFAWHNNANAQTWYHNLEKYWWYRYRLVNDFMYIDPTDSVGGSIPAQYREHNTNPHASFLGWEDATVELGHYIGALAVEYRMLKDNGWDTWRTEYELYHAAKAFDRLDQNAETFCENPDVNFPYNPQAWGTPFTLLLNNHTNGPLNGFFLRDDVPFDNKHTYTSLPYLPDFVSMHLEHFNRRGIAYDPSPSVTAYSTSNPRGCDCNIIPQSSSVYAQYVNNTSFMGRTPYPAVWPNLYPLPDAPVYPDEESQDQSTDMFTGLSLATNLLDNGLTTFGGIDLREDLANSQWRIVSWIAKPAMAFPEDIIPNLTYGGAPISWMIKNPLTMRCTYCATPAAYGTSQCFGGAYGPGLYAYSASRAVEQSYGAHYPAHLGECLALDATSNWPMYWLLFQSQVFMSIASNEPWRDICFSDAYTAVSGAWELRIPPYPPPIPCPGLFPPCFTINYSWLTIKNHAMDEHFCSPHFPLIYRINHSMPGMGGFCPECHTGISYLNLLNNAPECGPYAYSGYVYGNQEWSGSDRLTEWFHRDGYAYGNPDNNRDWNGLDYMMLFTLYAYHMGPAYLQYLINPYYTRNYNVNYPDGSVGTATNPLTLNWLEYISYNDKIGPGANVTFRAPHEQDMVAGPEFDAYALNFDAYIEDYVCEGNDGNSYHFAVNNSGPFEYYPTHTLFVARQFSPSDSLNSNIEDSITNAPIPHEYIQAFKDTINSLFQNNPNSDIVKSLVQLGIIDAKGNFTHNSLLAPDSMSTVNYQDWIEVFPNPTNSIAIISYELFEPNLINIQLLNALGQEFNNSIEPYQKEQYHGKYKIKILSDKLDSGLYLIKISIGNQLFIKKLTVL